MSASHIVAKAVRELAVSAETMDRARDIVIRVGIKEPEIVARKFYREWVNDIIVLLGRPQFKAAARNPDEGFIAWLESRIDNPYHVTYRAHDTVRAQHGDSVALLFAEVRWKQEVAWARRMRGSDNDRIAFMAEMWLKAARRDPGKLFRGLVETYAEEGVLDPGYREAAFHMLTAEEILGGAVDDRHWRPLWLRFAEREFGRMVNPMPRAKLTALAQQVREAEWQERVTRARASQAERLRAFRPALMVGVLSAAIERGLSSDDVVAAERRFIEGVERGEIDLAATPQPAWRVFLHTLSQWAETAPSPDEDERGLRLDAVRSLPPSWTDRLPEDFQRLGASSQRRLFAWFDAISRDGTRLPPLDPAVDYGMWLVEASRMEPEAHHAA